MDMGTILVLVLTGIVTGVVIILTRGVTMDICRIILRKKNHPHLMER